MANNPINQQINITGNFETQFKEYIKQMKKSGQITDKEADKMTKDFKGVSNSIDKLEKNTKSLRGSFDKLAAFSQKAFFPVQLAQQFGAAVGKVVDVTKELVNAYATQFQAEMQLQQALKNHGQTTNELFNRYKQFASELQGKSVFGDEETLQILTKLTQSGMDYAQSTEMVGAAANFASISGKSLTSSVDALHGIMTRGARTMEKYVSEEGRAKIAALDLNTELDAQQKYMMEMDIVVQDFNENLAGMTEIQREADGGLKALSNTWGDLKEVLGSALLPIVEEVTGALDTMITDVINQENAGEFESVIEDIQNVFSNLFTVIGNVYDVLKDVWNVVGVSDALGDLLDIVSKLSDGIAQFSDIWNKWMTGAVDQAAGLREEFSLWEDVIKAGLLPAMHQINTVEKDISKEMKFQNEQSKSIDDFTKSFHDNLKLSEGTKRTLVDLGWDEAESEASKLELIRASIEQRIEEIKVLKAKAVQLVKEKYIHEALVELSKKVMSGEISREESLNEAREIGANAMLYAINLTKDLFAEQKMLEDQLKDTKDAQEDLIETAREGTPTRGESGSGTGGTSGAGSGTDSTVENQYEKEYNALGKQRLELQKISELQKEIARIQYEKAEYEKRINELKEKGALGDRQAAHLISEHSALMEERLYKLREQIELEKDTQALEDRIALGNTLQEGEEYLLELKRQQAELEAKRLEREKKLEQGRDAILTELKLREDIAKAEAEGNAEQVEANELLYEEYKLRQRMEDQLKDLEFSQEKREEIIQRELELLKAQNDQIKANNDLSTRKKDKEDEGEDDEPAWAKRLMEDLGKISTSFIEKMGAVMSKAAMRLMEVNRPYKEEGETEAEFRKEKQDWKAIGDDIGKGITDGIGGLIETLLSKFLGKGLARFITNIIRPILDIFTGLFKGIGAALRAGISIIAPIFKGLKSLFSGIGNLIKGITEALSPIAGLLTMIVQLAGGLIGVIGNLIGAIGSGLGKAVGGITGFFDKAINEISEGFKKLGEDIRKAFGDGPSKVELLVRRIKEIALAMQDFKANIEASNKLLNETKNIFGDDSIQYMNALNQNTIDLNKNLKNMRDASVFLLRDIEKIKDSKLGFDDENIGDLINKFEELPNLAEKSTKSLKRELADTYKMLADAQNDLLAAQREFGEDSNESKIAKQVLDETQIYYESVNQLLENNIELERIQEEKREARLEQLQKEREVARDLAEKEYNRTQDADEYLEFLDKQLDKLIEQKAEVKEIEDIQKNINDLVQDQIEKAQLSNAELRKLRADAQADLDRYVSATKEQTAALTSLSVWAVSGPEAAAKAFKELMAISNDDFFKDDTAYQKLKDKLDSYDAQIEVNLDTQQFGELGSEINLYKKEIENELNQMLLEGTITEDEIAKKRAEMLWNRTYGALNSQRKEAESIIANLINNLGYDEKSEEVLNWKMKLQDIRAAELSIEEGITDQIEQQNDASEKQDEILTRLIRQREKLKAAGDSDGIQASNVAIYERLQELGTPPDEIQRILSTLPGFETGGITDSISLAHPGEAIFSPSSTQALASLYGTSNLKSMTQNPQSVYNASNNNTDVRFGNIIVNGANNPQNTSEFITRQIDGYFRKRGIKI